MDKFHVMFSYLFNEPNLIDILFDYYDKIDMCNIIHYDILFTELNPFDKNIYTRSILGNINDNMFNKFNHNRYMAQIFQQHAHVYDNIWDIKFKINQNYYTLKFKYAYKLKYNDDILRCVLLFIVKRELKSDLTQINVILAQ